MIKITSILFARLMPAALQATGRGGTSSWAQSTAEGHPQAKGLSRLYYGCIAGENTFVPSTQATSKSESNLDIGIGDYAIIDNGAPAFFSPRR